MTRLINADDIPWFVEGVGDIPVVTKDEIDRMPTVDTIPISYFAEAAYITRQSLRMPERSEKSKKALKEEAHLMLSWINHWRYENENVPDAMFKAWTEGDLIGKLPVVDAVPVDMIKGRINDLKKMMMDTDEDDVDLIWNLRTVIGALRGLLEMWEERKEE